MPNASAVRSTAATLRGSSTASSTGTTARVRRERQASMRAWRSAVSSGASTAITCSGGAGSGGGASSWPASGSSRCIAFESLRLFFGPGPHAHADDERAALPALAGDEERLVRHVHGEQRQIILLSRPIDRHLHLVTAIRQALEQL